MRKLVLEIGEEGYGRLYKTRISSTNRAIDFRRYLSEEEFFRDYLGAFEMDGHRVPRRKEGFFDFLGVDENIYNEAVIRYNQIVEQKAQSIIASVDASVRNVLQSRFIANNKQRTDGQN